MREILKGYYDKSLWVSGAIGVVAVTNILILVSGVGGMPLWVAGGVVIIAILNLALIYISRKVGVK